MNQIAAENINIISMTQWTFFVYLALAFLAGWTLKSVVQKNWFKRMIGINGRSNYQNYLYPQQGHTYIEYVPEVPKGDYYPYAGNKVQQVNNYVPQPVQNQGSYRQNNMNQVPTNNTPVNNNKVSQKVNLDDLKIIEGIGPKIEEVLKNAGIKDLSELAETPASRIKLMLDQAGPQFAMHDPASWSHQAHLANTGRLNELYDYQEFLVAGRE